MLEGILSTDLDSIWETVKPFIEQALEESPNDYTSQDIYEAVLLRDMQLWVWKENEKIIAALVTELRDFPRKKICTLVLGAGAGLDIWKDDDAIFRWAKERGCHSVEIFGRRGWGKALTGWREVDTHFRRDL